MRRSAVQNVQRVLGSHFPSAAASPAFPLGTKRWTAALLLALALGMYHTAGSFLYLYFSTTAGRAGQATLRHQQLLPPAQAPGAAHLAPQQPAAQEEAPAPPALAAPQPPELAPLPPQPRRQQQQQQKQPQQQPQQQQPQQPPQQQLQQPPLPSRLASMPRARLSASGAPLRALIFTMDSLSGVIEAAGRGGPAGEIKVRSRLTAALTAAGVVCDTVASDAELAARVQPDGSVPHDVLILDEWTLLAPGGAVRGWVAGRESHVYLLAYFGLASPAWPAFTLPPGHVLTAFPTSRGGAFLGWDAQPLYAPRPQHCTPLTATPGCLAEALAGLPPLPPRTPTGLVWGKKADYFPPRHAWLAAAAALAPLATTAPPGTPLPPGVAALGALTPEAWSAALAGSAFLLGLGDPLLGPSPLDALAAGTVYINPVFEGAGGGAGGGGVRAELAAWGSQHPYLAAAVGMPYVCSAQLDNATALGLCVQHALQADLPPLLPPDFTQHSYYARVAAAFRGTLFD